MASGLSVELRVDGPTAHIILNREDRLNAINNDMFRRLDDHVARLAGEAETVRSVIVRGAGKCFSAGHDLQDIASGDAAHDVSFQSSVLERLANLPQAVIAAVHGHCYTGALELALASDFILAARSARFADTHAKWALTPVWGMSQRLPRLVGQAKAREMMFTARTIDGREAAEIGLAASCFEDTEFLERVDAIASMIAENSAFSIAAYKRLLAETDNVPLHLGLAHEVRNSAGVGPDMGERIAAFSKRKA